MTYNEKREIALHGQKVVNNKLVNIDYDKVFDVVTSYIVYDMEQKNTYEEVKWLLKAVYQGDNSTLNPTKPDILDDFNLLDDEQWNNIDIYKEKEDGNTDSNK